MKWLSKYNSVINFNVDKSRQSVSDFICQRFRSCAVAGDEITLKMKPTVLDPFAGRGVVIFHFTTTGESHTKVSAEVRPMAITKEGVYLIAVFFVLTFGVSFLFSPLYVSFGYLIGGLALMAGLITIAQRVNNGKLENLVFAIEKKLKSSRGELA